MMTSDRIKEIQDETAYPESVSVMLALKRVWHETAQPLKDEIKENRMYQLGEYKGSEIYKHLIDNYSLPELVNAELIEANEQTQSLKDEIESVRIKLIGIALRTTDDDICQRLEDIFKPLRPKQ